MHNQKIEKTILHMDGDAFFVGVEVAKNQKLKNLPVVTGAERGIVSALSYEAKALGIIRGMPIFKVKREYPSVIILPGDYQSYAHYSSMMFDVVRRYADDVEEYSIDECFADLTGLEATLKMSYNEIANRIQGEVRDELLLSVTVGLAPTKVLAKIASKWVKPRGLTIITRDTAVGFLAKTSIESVWGIGPRTADHLKKAGIQTAQDFTRQDFSWVKRNYSKPYQVIWHELQGVLITGIDSKPKTLYSSMQKTRTFHPPTNDKSFLLSQLSKNIEDACRKARHYKLVPKKIVIFLKTQSFRYVTIVIPLPSPTASPEVLISLVRERFAEIHTPQMQYRATGVSLLELFLGDTAQGNLFEDSSSETKKFDSIHKQIDSLEEKLGKRVVYLASTHKAMNQKQMGADSTNLDRDLLFL